MACSTCGGFKEVRVQTNPAPSRGMTPYGYEKSSGGLSKVAAQSGVSTSTMNPYANSSGPGLTRKGVQSNPMPSNMNPVTSGNPSTRVSPSYGSSSFAGQRFSTTGRTESGGLNLSKFVGRGS